MHHQPDSFCGLMKASRLSSSRKKDRFRIRACLLMQYCIWLDAGSGFMYLSSFTFHRWKHSGQKRVPGGTRFFGKLQHPLHKVRHVKFDPIAGKTQFPGLMVSAVNSLSGSTGFIENSFAAISHGRLNVFRVITRTSFGSQMRPVSPRMKEGAS